MIVRYMDVSFLHDKKQYQRFRERLSPARREKADRLMKEDDRYTCVGAGMLLDIGLQEHGLREKECCYALSPTGKPYFPDRPTIHFNISHSGSYVMVAMDNEEIGCDIQRIRPLSQAVIRRVFHPTEQEAIGNSDCPVATAIRLWTLKESIVKFTGEGIKSAPTPFSIHLGETATVFGAESPLRLIEYNGIPDVCAAVCTAQQNPSCQWVEINGASL